MHQIRYESYSSKTPFFEVFKQDKDIIRHHTIYNNLDESIQESLLYPKFKQTFLLDDSRFSFFKFDVFKLKNEKVTIEDLQQIIKDKQYHIQTEKQTNWVFLSSFIDNIFIDGEEKKYVIWEKWNIFFRLYLVYINNISLNAFDSKYNNILNNPNISIIPQSFYTMLFIKNSLKRDNFTLLYIDDLKIKAINIKNWFYTDIQTLNFGLLSLKKMYKNDNLFQYWWEWASDAKNNSLASSMIEELLWFYCWNLTSWLQEHKFSGNDVFLISSVVKNEMFIQSFSKEYNKHYSNYIIPFNHSDTLNTFEHKWEPEFIDILVYLNNIKEKK